MNTQTTTKKVLKRTTTLNTLKVLSNDAKNLLIEIEKEYKGKSIKLNPEKSLILINGYLGKPKPEHFNSSLRYAYARVLCSVLGYAKTETGKNKTLIEDIKRVNFDSENKIIGFIFEDKNKPIQ